MKTTVTNIHNYTLGELLEQPDRSKTYLKVVNKEKCHHGLKYQKGLIVDPIPFNDDKNKSCCPGRIYFTTLEHMWEFVDYGVYVWEVTIPEDANVILDPNGDKYGADMLVFGKCWKINDFLNHIKPITIGGNADFRNLTSAKGLESLQSIGVDAYFDSLTSAEGLENLQSIGWNAYFDKLNKKEKDKIPALRSTL